MTVSVNGSIAGGAATGAGTGTVTSVAGTGSPNGLTLTGTVTETGDITLGGNVTSFNSATTTVDVGSATAPSTGQVLTATDSTHATWQAPTAAGGLSAGRTITTTANLASTDVNKFIISNDTVAYNITVTNDATLGTSGAEEIQIYILGAGLPTIVAGSGVSLTGVQGYTALCQYSIVKLRRTATSTWSVDLTGYTTKAGVAYTGTTHDVVDADVDTDTPNTSSNGSEQVITIPLAASLPVRLGAEIYFMQLGVGKITFAHAGTLTAEGSKFSSNGAGSIICAKNVGADSWVVVGNRAA